MADDVKPGFSMEVSGQPSGKNSVSKRGRKVKEEIGIGLIIVAILIIAGFGVYWYFFAPQNDPVSSELNRSMPDVVSSDLSSDIYSNIPTSESVVPEAPSTIPNPLDEVYINPFE